jgi:hypothetical protein
VVDDLFESFERKLTDPLQESYVEVEFVTRYQIPENALKTITFFLEDISPKTVQAFTNSTYVPELF